AGERDLVAEPAAEEVVDGDVQPLPDEVEACELDRRVELRAIVVEARGRIAELEAKRLELKRVVPEEVRLQARERELGRLAAAAHLTEPDEPVLGLELHDRADEAAPVRAVRMPQRRLERDGHGGRADVGDLHLGSTTGTWAINPPSTFTS